MATRTITGRIYKPDGTAWASGAVTAELMTRIAVGSGYVVGQYDEETTTDANGDFTLALETPAADAWQYRITLPDDNRITFNLEAGAALTILDIVNDLNLDATVSAATLTALIAAKADRPVGHTVGNLATLAASGDAADSGIAPAAIGDAVTIQGVNVDATAPGDGEILIYSSGAGEYAPGALSASSIGALPLTAGAGVGVTGTLYLDPGAGDSAQLLKIPVTSGDGADFNLNLHNTTFSGVEDITFNWGFHNAAAGPTDSSKHAWYLQLEYDYNEGGTRYAEYHLNYYDDGGTPNFRPFQINVRTDGAYSYAVYTGDLWTWRTRAASSLMVLGTGTFNLYTATNQFDGTLRVLNTLTTTNNTAGLNANLTVSDSGKTTFTTNIAAELEYSGWSVIDFLSPITQTAASAQWNVASFIVNGAAQYNVIGGSGTTDTARILRLQRITSATAAAGFGAYLEQELEASNGASYAAGRLDFAWSDATWNTRQGQVSIQALDSAGTARTGVAVRGDGTRAQVILPDLPTSDPTIAGALWNDSGTVKVSSG